MHAQASMRDHDAHDWLLGASECIASAAQSQTQSKRSAHKHTVAFMSRQISRQDWPFGVCGERAAGCGAGEWPNLTHRDCILRGAGEQPPPLLPSARGGSGCGNRRRLAAARARTPRRSCMPGSPIKPLAKPSNQEIRSGSCPLRVMMAMAPTLCTRVCPQARLTQRCVGGLCRPPWGWGLNWWWRW